MGGVRDIDRGYKRIMREMRGIARGAYVKTGIQADAGNEPKKGRDGAFSGESLLDVAIALHFGTETIPPRPFIEGAVAEFSGRWHKVVKRIATRIIDGKQNLQSGLDELGEVLAADIKRYINTIEYPPLADSTIAAKGSSKPLIDTTQLRESVRSVPVLGEGR